MAAYVVLVLGAVDDPVGAVEKLLDRAHARPLDGGVGWILEADDADPKRAATRARQARYRRRRRDARDAYPRDASDAADLVENSNSAELQRPTDRREVGRSLTRENDANDARRDDADDATRRDAQPSSPWRIEPPTDLEREQGQARIRELRDQLREMRGRP